MSKKIERWIKSDIVIYIIMCIAVYLIAIPFFDFRTFSNTDEFTSLAVPAYLAGKDWSEVARLSGFHGFGFTIIMTPIFALCTDASSAYMYTLFASLLVRALSGFFMFKILLKHINLSRTYSICVSVIYIISTMAPDDSSVLSAMTEIPLGFIVMLAAYLVLENISGSTKKKMYSVIIGVLLAYSYTLHSRCIVIWLCFACLYLLYLWLYRDSFISVVHFLIGFLVTIALCLGLTNWIKDCIYLVGEDIALDNDPSTVAVSASYLVYRLFEWESLKQILLTFASLLVTVFLVSGGAAILSLSQGFDILGRMFKLGRKAEIADRKKIFLAIWGWGCVLLINFMISITSVNLVMVDADVRWLTYIRYCKPFLGCVFILAVLFIEEEKVRIGKVIAFLSGTYLLIYYYWYHVFEQSYGVEYSILNRIFYDGMDIDAYFRTFFSVVVAFIFVICLALIHKKKIWVYGLLLVFSIVVAQQHTEFYIENNDRNMAKINRSVLGARRLQEAGYEVYGDPNAVAYNFRLQFAMYETTLNIKEIDDLDLKKTAVFTDEYMPEYLKGTRCIILDKGEYIYTLNQDILELFEDKEIRWTS